MKANDIIKLYHKEYPNFQADLDSAIFYISKKDFKRGGDKYRDIGRELLKLKLFALSIEMYMMASATFKTGGKYLKAIATELTLFEIYKICGNVFEMASTYEKIASFYRYFIGNMATAGRYYMMSAKIHEENQNYLSAFTKAKFAFEVFEKTNDQRAKKDASSLALRMALQSKYFEKAGIYAQKLQALIERDYSSHYISVCNKGYMAFQKTDRKLEALLFIDEVIKAHFEYGQSQRSIFQRLLDAQKLNLHVKQDINIDYHNKSINLCGEDVNRRLRYLTDMKNYAQDLSLESIATNYYILEQELRQASCLHKKEYLRYYGFSLWNISCRYGRSLQRWLAVSAVFIVCFGLLFTPWNYNGDNQFLKMMSDFVKPNIKGNTELQWFAPYYYSIVTIATLGYGDIAPSNTSAQIFSAFEVLIGYLMFGGLLSVFSKRITR